MPPSARRFRHERGKTFCVLQMRANSGETGKTTKIRAQYTRLSRFAVASVKEGRTRRSGLRCRLCGQHSRSSAKISTRRKKSCANFHWRGKPGKSTLYFLTYESNFLGSILKIGFLERSVIKNRAIESSPVGARRHDRPCGREKMSRRRVRWRKRTRRGVRGAVRGVCRRGSIFRAIYEKHPKSASVTTHGHLFGSYEAAPGQNGRWCAWGSLYP